MSALLPSRSPSLFKWQSPQREMAATAPTKTGFTEEEMAVDGGLGYPKTYAKLCRRPNALDPCAQGPPFAFLPYILKPEEALRAKDLDQMFPIIDQEAVPSVNPRGFVNLLWKQLDHIGNAGFDPALFRVDPYGNVLYLHADSASPLAWDIDHWFPCSRGGRTVPSNLRLLQWQVCKRKHDKLEFLVPWWDLQLGISVNRFLSIFASKSSDFRSRAFSFMFYYGGSEKLNTLQTVDAHSFPQHFVDRRQKVGLAPASIVRASDALVLRPLDANRSLKHNYPIIAAKKITREEDHAKENSHPAMENSDDNPYLSISMARDSLRQSEETRKKQAEISRLDDELEELKQKSEAERVALQELEALLIKRRQRVEKSRRLAEAQSSYKALLEKMCRETMHEHVVYKEQVRLNQDATSALIGRLEAQRTLCGSFDDELRLKFKQRDEIEKQKRGVWELRKRLRMDDTILGTGCDGVQLTRSPLQKELRIFLEEEKRASEAGPSNCEDKEETGETTKTGSSQKHGSNTDVLLQNEKPKNLATTRAPNSNNSIKPKERDPAPWTQKNDEAEQSGNLTNQKLRQFSTSDQHVSKPREAKILTIKRRDKIIIIKPKRKDPLASTQSNNEAEESGSIIKENLQQFTVSDQHVSKICEPKKLTIKNGDRIITIKQKDKNPDPWTQRNNKAKESSTITNEKLKQLAISGRYLRMTNELNQSSSHQVFQEEAEEGYKTSDARKDNMLLSDRQKETDTQKTCIQDPSVSKINTRNQQNRYKRVDEEYLSQIGKGNVEKWIEMLLQGSGERSSSLDTNQDQLNSPDSPDNILDKTVEKMSSMPPPKETKLLRFQSLEEKAGAVSNPFMKKLRERKYNKFRHTGDATDMFKKSNHVAGANDSASREAAGSRKSFEVKDPRSESSRGFRSLPSSPSVMIGMRSAECMGKKLKVLGVDSSGNANILSTNSNKFIKACTKAIKRAVNL